MGGKAGSGGKDDRGDSEEGGQPVSGSTGGNTTMDSVSRHRNEGHGMYGRGSEQAMGGIGGVQPCNVHSTAS